MCKVFVRPRSDQDGMNERGTATLASSAGKVLADADEWRADFSTSSLTVATGTAAGGPTGGAVPNQPLTTYSSLPPPPQPDPSRLFQLQLRPDPETRCLGALLRQRP